MTAVETMPASVELAKDGHTPYGRGVGSGRPARERLLSRAVALANGCWEWRGFLTGEGYPGGFRLDGRLMSAHRASYEIFIGPIPRGLHLDHLCHTNDPSCTAGIECRHRRCVNPQHLEPVTCLENTLRSNGAYLIQPRTHCKRGHEYRGPRDIDKHGWHTCSTCRRTNEMEKRRLARLAK